MQSPIPEKDYLVTVLERYGRLIPSYVCERILAYYKAERMRVFIRWGFSSHFFWLKNDAGQTIRFSWTTPDAPVMVSVTPAAQIQKVFDFHLPVSRTRAKKVDFPRLEISAE